MKTKLLAILLLLIPVSAWSWGIPSCSDVKSDILEYVTDAPEEFTYTSISETVFTGAERHCQATISLKGKYRKFIESRIETAFNSKEHRRQAENGDELMAGVGMMMATLGVLKYENQISYIIYYNEATSKYDNKFYTDQLEEVRVWADTVSVLIEELKKY